MTTHFLPALVLAAVAPGIPTQEAASAAPERRLERMVEALRSASSLSYRAVSEGAGAATTWPRFQASVRVERIREAGRAPARLELRGSGLWPGRREPTPVEVVFDGQTVRWLSHAERKLVERTFLPDGPGASDWPDVTRHFGRAGSELLVWEALSDRPLLGEDEAVEREGTVFLDGIECEVLFVERASERPRWTRWAVGPDHLPRRKESGWIGEDGKAAATILTLEEWALDGTEAAFELPAPDGFEFEPWTAPRSQPAPMLALGSLAPEFALMGADDRPFELAETRGSVVLLDFWATYCAPCVPAMRHAQSLHERFGDDGLVVLTVNAFERGGGPDPTAQFRRYGLDYRLLLDGTEVAELYRVAVLPTIYLIDRQGQIAAAYRGFRGAGDEIDRRVEALLAE